MPLIIVIGKEVEFPRFEAASSLGFFQVIAGNVVIDQFGNGGVLTNEDKTGRDGQPLFLPEVKGLFIVALEGLHGGL